ncbi:hypothetical protein Q1695_001071 [Nippostrongylus brasiliensis]|nr:hypothetical protein Q1695_001071 [Nippostrongylus brasiliensis]
MDQIALSADDLLLKRISSVSTNDHQLIRLPLLSTANYVRNSTSQIFWSLCRGVGSERMKRPSILLSSNSIHEEVSRQG